jgi:hypothetical protein
VDDAYRAAWNELERLKRDFRRSLVVTVAGGIAVVLAHSSPAGGTLLTIVTAMAALTLTVGMCWNGIVMSDMRDLRCPRCAERLAVTFFQAHPMTEECKHCHLHIGEG